MDTVQTRQTVRQINRGTIMQSTSHAVVVESANSWVRNVVLGIKGTLWNLHIVRSSNSCGGQVVGNPSHEPISCTTLQCKLTGLILRCWPQLPSSMSPDHCFQNPGRQSALRQTPGLKESQDTIISWKIRYTNIMNFVLYCPMNKTPRNFRSQERDR